MWHLFHRRVLVTGALGLLLATRAWASPLVVNGGFESGNFSGWTLTGGPCEFVLSHISGQGTCTGIDSGGDPGAHSGTYAAYFGQYGFAAGISQTITTTPGTWYDLTFSLANTSYAPLGGTTPNEFQVGWNGTTVFDQHDMPVSGYKLYDFLVFATGTHTTLSFAGQQNPAYFVLDDVSVTPVGTPEPATLALVGMGFATFAARRRRRQS
jgi:hypothetical protein